MSNIVLESDKCWKMQNPNKYPSVTAMIDAFKDKTELLKWIERTPDAQKIITDSKISGIAFHKLNELYVLGRESEQNEQVKLLTARKMFKSVKPYIDKYCKTVIAVESKLVSELYCFVGMFDLLSIDQDGKVVVVDYKNARKAKECLHNGGIEYKQQLGCYALLIKEIWNLDVDYGVILVSNRFTYITQEYKFDIKECIVEATKMLDMYLEYIMNIIKENDEAKIIQQ